MDVTELAARQEIAELHYRYARGIDKQDWKTFRSAFATTVQADFSHWGVGANMEMPADALAEIVAVLFSKKGLVTQHYMTNFLIDVDGDRATGDAYVLARHKIGDEQMDLNAYYECTYTREPDGWKIRSITLRPRWDEGHDVARFFEIPDPAPTGRGYLFVTATPLLAQHDALERYVSAIVPMLMQAGGSEPTIMKQDESVVGSTDTWMSMIVTFPDAESLAAGRAVFDSPEYEALVVDRDRAFVKMNIAFYSDMPNQPT